MTKDVEDLNSKKLEKLNLTQAEVKMEWKNPITLLENSKESLASKMNQAQDIISGLKDKRV